MGKPKGLPGWETPDQYPVLLHELAVYSLKAEKIEQGIHYIFGSLEASAALGSIACVIRCVRLFEQFRPQASAEDQERYKQLISRVQVAHSEQTVKTQDQL